MKTIEYCQYQVANKKGKILDDDTIVSKKSLNCGKLNIHGSYVQKESVWK